MARHASPTSENLKVFRTSLADSRRLGRPWYEMADLLARGFASAGDEKTLADFRFAAMDATGYSAGIVKRYTTLRDRLAAIAQAAGVPLESILSPRFNANEVAARIHDRNPAVGIETLQELARGKMKLRAVRDRLTRTMAMEALPSGRVFLRSRQAARRHDTLAFMESSLRSGHRLWESRVIVRRPKRGPFPRQGFEVFGSGGRRSVGIDVYDVDRLVPLHHIGSGIVSSVLLSTFFPKFWLAFSPSSLSTQMDYAKAVLDFLDIPWIGILQVHENGRVEAVRQPKGRPQPDRIEKYGLPWPGDSAPTLGGSGTVSGNVISKNHVR